MNAPTPATSPTTSNSTNGTTSDSSQQTVLALQKQLEALQNKLCAEKEEKARSKSKEEILKPWMWCRIKMADGTWSEHSEASTFSNNWHVAHL